jgi:hypothetical protein
MPHFTSRDEFCNYRFVDMTESGEIENNKINHETIGDLLDKYAAVPHARELYNSVADDLFEVLTNPGVQTNVIFGTTIPTVASFNFEENPKLKTDENKHVAPTS